MWRLSRPPLVFWLFGILTGIVAFLFAGVALHVAQVFGFVFLLFYYLGGVDPSSWEASSMTSPLIFLGGLGLGLTISRRRVVTLSLVFVFVPISEPSIGVVLVFLHRRFVTSWASEINLLSLKGWLWVGLPFCIPGFLTTSFYMFRSCLQWSNWACMDGCSLF